MPAGEPGTTAAPMSTLVMDAIVEGGRNAGLWNGREQARRLVPSDLIDLLVDRTDHTDGAVAGAPVVDRFDPVAHRELSGWMWRSSDPNMLTAS